MKVCLITPLFDPWAIGGAERYTATLAHALSKDHEVIVITTAGPTSRIRSQPKDNPDIIEIKTKNVCSIYDYVTKFSSAGLAKKSIWHILDIWNPFIFVSIRQIIMREKSDIVHTNGVKGFSGSLFSAIKNVPHVLTMHDYELISPWAVLFRSGAPISRFNFLERMFTNYMRKMSSTIDAAISPSKFVLDMHLHHGFFKEIPRYVVPNGNIARDNVPSKNFSPDLVYLGQVTESKGLHVAVQAFKKLHNPTARFHIIGTGPYMSTLKHLAAQDHRIIIYGYIQDQSSINEVLNKCSYFVFPSIWYENFPLVINEMMNQGLPVIASNIGGVPEIVKHSYNGFLVRPNNVEDLVSVLDLVMTNENLVTQMSKNAIESSKKFPVEKNVEQILEIYHRHLRKKNR